MKTTNLVIALIFCLALIGQACTKEYIRIEGMGSITTETLNIADFTAIRLEGTDDVDIIYGSEQKVEVSGHPNIISRIKTDVFDGVWEMGLENGNYGSYELHYSLTLPTLNSVEVVGSASVHILTAIQADDFELFVMGSGDFRGFDLSTTESYVEIIGSGNCEITASQQLDAVIEGSGNIYYKGSPSIQTDITGSGRILDAN
jgi:hypothetical protein